jgi:hypothetical protein
VDVSALTNPEGCFSMCGMGLREKRGFGGGSPVVAMLALAALSLALVALVALDANALCLVPALAIAVPLLMRRYPGERMLGGMSMRGVRWPRLRACVPHGERRFASAPHGGLLIARALAVRPPPAVCAAS